MLMKHSLGEGSTIQSKLTVTKILAISLVAYKIINMIIFSECIQCFGALSNVLDAVLHLLFMIVNKMGIVPFASCEK